MLSISARGLGHDSAGIANSMVTKAFHAALTRRTLVLPYVESMQCSIPGAGFDFAGAGARATIFALDETTQTHPLYLRISKNQGP